MAAVEGEGLEFTAHDMAVEPAIKIMGLGHGRS